MKYSNQIIAKLCFSSVGCQYSIISIDRITDCLIDTRTGEEVETEYRMREIPIRPKDYRGWKFNWSITEKNGYDIDVDIVETAPHNYSHTGRYERVGAHLFAIACQVSLDAGYDGFVAFTSKSDLVEYYKEKYEKVGDSMLAVAKKTTDYVHDIAYYAKDSRLTEPSDGKRYEWRKMIELSKELGSPLTDAEAEKFRVQ